MIAVIVTTIPGTIDDRFNINIPISIRTIAKNKPTIRRMFVRFLNNLFIPKSMFVVPFGKRGNYSMFDFIYSDKIVYTASGGNAFTKVES